MARNIGILASKEELEEMYWGQGMSAYQIAPYFNTTPQTVWGWLKHYGIVRRPAGGYHWKGQPAQNKGKRLSFEQRQRLCKIPYPSKEVLLGLYETQRMAIRDIAKFYKISTSVVCRWFEDFGIETRGLRQSHLNYRPEKLDNILRGCARRPTRPERQLDALLQAEFPSEWLYNGAHGYLKLEGKVPDFININGKKQLIELFGDYWHKGENPEDKAAIFRRYGFALLVIWEHELENPESLKERIISFGNSLGKEKKSGITYPRGCEIASLQGDLHVKWSQSRGTLNQEARESRAKPEREGVETGRLTLGNQMMVQSDLVGNHKR